MLSQAQDPVPPGAYSTRTRSGPLRVLPTSPATPVLPNKTGQPIVIGNDHQDLRAHRVTPDVPHFAEASAGSRMGPRTHRMISALFRPVARGNSPLGNSPAATVDAVVRDSHEALPARSAGSTHCWQGNAKSSPTRRIFLPLASQSHRQARVPVTRANGCLMRRAVRSEKMSSLYNDVTRVTTVGLATAVATSLSVSLCVIVCHCCSLR